MTYYNLIRVKIRNEIAIGGMEVSNEKGDGKSELDDIVLFGCLKIISLILIIILSFVQILSLLWILLTIPHLMPSKKSLG